jgi:hypothetical protein
VEPHVEVVVAAVALDLAPGPLEVRAGDAAVARRPAGGAVARGAEVDAQLVDPLGQPPGAEAAAAAVDEVDTRRQAATGHDDRGRRRQELARLGPRHQGGRPGTRAVVGAGALVVEVVGARAQRHPDAGHDHGRPVPAGPGRPVVIVVVADTCGAGQGGQGPRHVDGGPRRVADAVELGPHQLAAARHLEGIDLGRPRAEQDVLGPGGRRRPVPLVELGDECRHDLRRHAPSLVASRVHLTLLVPALHHAVGNRATKRDGHSAPTTHVTARAAAKGRGTAPRTPPGRPPRRSSAGPRGRVSGG